ncbi:tail fiber domain-containing protein [Kitasatospora sp. NBC_01302]|uniref:tail fiber domain-containing protein n=1 Tax=Kitasatospora sp. NBC_01302 TaxID=2903575 RepID=UPI002E0F7459|nr:tail fiber domain-containing protein [Kitasatospora sp. NBC_01302]
MYAPRQGGFSIATSSYPFDGQATTETDFSRLFRELQDSGIAGTATGLDLKVAADASGMKVSIQPGFALVRGHAFLSTAVEVLPVAAADTAARTDRVVLRLNPTANNITLAVLKGAPGGSAPALTQTDTDLFEISLGLIAVSASASNIALSAVTDDRSFLGTRVGTWTSSTRPASARVGKLGLNRTTSKWEYWDGAAWTDLAPIVSWTSVTNKPSTFPPSAHSHTVDYNDVVNKPGSFPPSGHSHSFWSLTDIPREYTPAGHTHWWDQIQGKPGQFPPTDHGHGQYLEWWGTINRANGSDRPHSNTPAGSNWYAVWVDGNHNFCRNTSSIRFKENVRDVAIAPTDVLALRPRVYDRKPTVNDEGEQVEGRKDEYGLIAEEVAKTLPEIVVHDEEGRIDSVRYDLLGVALLPVVQEQARRLAALERRIEELGRDR